MKRLKIYLVVLGVKQLVYMRVFFTKTRTHPSIKKGDKSSLGINVRCPIDAH